MTKFARVLDRESGGFALEYNNTLGKRNMMRLDAATYEQAVLEARSYLGITADDRDDDGNQWEVE